MINYILLFRMMFSGDLQIKEENIDNEFVISGAPEFEQIESLKEEIAII